MTFINSLVAISILMCSAFCCSSSANCTGNGTESKNESPALSYHLPDVGEGEPVEAKIIHLISEGKIREAVKNFGIIARTSPTKLRSGNVITDAYENDKGPKNFLNILGFVRATTRHSCSEGHDSTSILYNSMKEKDDLSSVNILTLHSYMDKYGCTEPQTRDLKEEVRLRAMDTLHSFAEKIRSGNLSNVDDLILLQPREAKFLRRYTGDLIRMAYNGTMEHAESVVEFIGSIPSFEDQIIAYVVLFEEMKRVGGFNGYGVLMVAYKAERMAALVSRFPWQELLDDGTEEKEKFPKLLAIRDSLPSGIKTVLWTSFITFQSKQNTSDYFGLWGNSKCGKVDALSCPTNVSSEFLYDYGVRKVGSARYFRFQIPGTEFYVGSDGTVGKLEEGKEKEHEFDWEVVPVQNGEYFYLRNRRNKKILEVRKRSKETGRDWDCADEVTSNCNFIVGVNGPHQEGNERQLWKIL